MYQKIMVPLDGSELSECVLPHLETIFNGCQVKDVLLVRVVEPVNPSVGAYVYPEDAVKRLDAEHKAEVEQYLDAMIKRLSDKGIVPQTAMLTGKPGDILGDYAEKNGVDLILIATHGRSGVSRWAWGSVADRVLRSACVPVLMVRAPGCVPGL